MHYFDAYPIQSRLRKVHPSVKMGLFAIYITLALLSHSVLISATLSFALILAIVHTARIGLIQLFRLMLIPASFVFLGSISVMVELNPTQSLLQVTWHRSILGVTSSSLHSGLLLFTRSFSAISVLYALILNTPIIDMFSMLRKLKVPGVLLDIMVLVYRNIFIFSDTAQCIYTSQKSRLGYRNLKTSLRSTAQLGGRMFVLAGVRAEYLYRSMESRCYSGKINTLPGNWNVSPMFLVTTTLLAAIFATAIFLY